MMKRIALLSIGMLAAFALFAGDGIPAHPNELKFEETRVTIPNKSDYEVKLKGGNIAYIAEDHNLPLVKVWILAYGGSYLEKDGEEGLAAITGRMMREGGIDKYGPTELDEKLDFLATEISCRIGSEDASLSLNSLTENMDESLEILFNMVVNPRFDAERLAVVKSQQIETMKRRNDDTRTIEPTVWGDLMLGEKFYTNRNSTETSINGITPDKMRAFARRIFTNGNLVFAVSGDINKKDMIKRLNAFVENLPKYNKVPKSPDQAEKVSSGLFGVHKSDVNQTRVRLGLPSVNQDHPDAIALSVMNMVLGGNSFSSRITSRVRSDEGLAYSAGSRIRNPVRRPGEFYGYLQTKNRTAAYAIKIVLEEFNRIRDELVTDEELMLAKQGLVAWLPEQFKSAENITQTLAQAHIDGVKDDYWHKFQDRVAAVTKDDVRKVAGKHLTLDKLTYLLVGNLDEAAAGDGEHGTLQEVTGLELERVPLKDPLTQEVIKESVN